MTCNSLITHHLLTIISQPPQKNFDAPWIDEVQQSVSVNGQLNGRDGLEGRTCHDGQCKANFVHQAGAYQRDSPDTDTPFFSPSLAKYCSGNSCYFASWYVLYVHLTIILISCILLTDALCLNFLGELRHMFSLLSHHQSCISTSILIVATG